jgi:hypothetical protein
MGLSRAATGARLQTLNGALLHKNARGWES